MFRYLCLIILIVVALQPSQVRAQTPLPQPAVPRGLSLDRAEDILLKNNLAIAAAKYGIDIARAQRLAASMRLNPTVTVSAQQLDLTNPLRHLFSDSGVPAQRSYTFQYDHVIERGNKRRLRTEAAELMKDASESALADTIRQQLFQLSQAFFGALLARENLKVADDTLQLADGTQKLIQLQVSVGRAPEWDLIKYESTKVLFHRDVVSAQLAYQQAVRDLLRTMGAQGSNVVTTVASNSPEQIAQLAGDPGLDLIGDLDAQPISALSLTELRATVETRPDVLAAQKTVLSSEKNLELARALRTRDVDVAVNYTFTGGYHTAGVSASVPLFLHNNHQADIDLAQAQLRQNQAQLNQARLQAVADIEKAYKAYELSQKMLTVYTAESPKKAEQSVSIARASYREGATSLLELQDAQRTYNQVRIGYNQSRSDYVMSLYQLQLATGKPLVVAQRVAEEQ